MLDYNKFDKLIEATDPYVFMLHSESDYHRLRSNVEFTFRNLEDPKLKIEIVPKKLTIYFKGCTYRDLFVGLMKGFDILTPRFSYPDDLINHTNDPKQIVRAKKAFNITTKKFSDFRFAVPYTLNRTVGEYCNIFHNIEGDCKERFSNYVGFEPAWHQEEYTEEIFPNEEPWKLWMNKLEIPFAIGNYFSRVFGTDSIDVE